MMVKQYDMISSYMAESPSGMYVLRKDYQTLEAERDKLRELSAELADALSELAEYKDAIICYASTIDEHYPNKVSKMVDDALNKAREVMK